MSNVLGKISFLDLPDVNGQGIVVLGSGTANQISTSQTDGTLTISLASDPVIPGIAGMRLPSGATADRSATPSAGEIRFNTTLSAEEIFNGSAWLPTGKVIQMVTGTIAASSGNTQVPFDNTVPTSSEGFQIWSTSFTPKSASSQLVIKFTVSIAHATTNRTITMSVFAGTTNIGSTFTGNPAGSASSTPVLGLTLPLQVVYSPGTTSAITISARIGTNGGGTLYVNRAAAQTLGGATVTDYTIMEII